MEKSVMSVFNDDILKEAGRRFGTTKESLNFINDFENFIYEFKRGGQEYILRLTHSSHRDENLVNGELDWIYYLHNKGANVCSAIFSDDNKLVERINASDGSYFLATAFEKAKGCHVNRKDETLWNDEIFEKWGQTVGKMHALTKSYKLSNSKYKRIEWDEDDLIVSADKYLSRYDGTLLEKQIKLIDWCRSLPKDENTYGLVHTDVHEMNFFVDNGSITVFDFDDCAYNWFMNDIAIVLFYVAWGIPSEDVEGRRELSRRFLTNFLRGYRKENHLDSPWLRHIPQFLKLREITVFSVVNKKWDLDHLNDRQSAFIEGFKHNIENNVPFVDLDFEIFS